MDVWDGDWLLMEHDPATGRCVWMTSQDDQLVFRVDQPLDQIFTANHEDLMETNGKRFKEWNRVASIPHHLVYHNGVSEAIEQQDGRFLSRVLNDIDNRKFRTSRGRV